MMTFVQLFNLRHAGEFKPTTSRRETLYVVPVPGMYFWDVDPPAPVLLLLLLRNASVRTAAVRTPCTEGGQALVVRWLSLTGGSRNLISAVFYFSLLQQE